MNKKNLLGLSRTDLEELFSRLGERPFRGRQLFNQIYQRREFDLSNMTDLPNALRTRLLDEHHLSLPQVARMDRSSDGTIKFLFRLNDGKFVETVYIPEQKRETLCISSQVGCDVGCTFCLTALMGLERNLQPAEIVGQVLAVIQEGVMRPQGFNIVFMGMGEPLYNYKSVMRAFRLMTDPEGMAMSHRRITVSTSGVVPVLQRLAGESRVPNLAISLNSTTDRFRDQIMPLNQRWNICALLKTCREFPLESRKRITFEYVLLKDQNDSLDDALRLTRLLTGIPSKINLIPYNPNPGLAFDRPSAERIEQFRRVLVGHHYSAFVRKTRGDDISAACGQLAHLEAEQAGV